MIPKMDAKNAKLKDRCCIIFARTAKSKGSSSVGLVRSTKTSTTFSARLQSWERRASQARFLIIAPFLLYSLVLLHFTNPPFPKTQSAIRSALKLGEMSRLGQASERRARQSNQGNQRGAGAVVTTQEHLCECSVHRYVFSCTPRLRCDHEFRNWQRRLCSPRCTVNARLLGNFTLKWC
jgi:hypothetical protein